MFRFLSPIFACVLLLAASFAAATPAEEQQRLNALQQSLTKLRAELQEMRVEIQGYPDKITSAQTELMRAQEEHKAAEEAAAAATDARDKSLKDHAVLMAERRVRSETRMLERYQRYQDDLQQEITAAQQDMAELEQRIAAQTTRLANARANQQQAGPAPAITPPAAASARSQAAPRAAAAAPAPAAAQSQAVASPAPAELPALSAADYEAFQTAKAAMERAESMVAREPNANARFSNLQLTGSDIPDTAFTHLGANQYRADVVLPSGRQSFRIDSLRFRVTISPDNAGESYVFLVDASDRVQLKASYFKEYLLNYLDSEPKLAVQAASVAQAEEEALEKVTLSSGKTVALSEDDVYALEIAREHSQLLQDIVREGKGTPSFSSLSISGDQIENTAFEHLGQDQYRVEVTVRAGRQNIKVNRSSFRIDIPDADEGERYLFFVDATRPSRLQLTYYKKSILDYL